MKGDAVASLPKGHVGESESPDLAVKLEQMAQGAQLPRRTGHSLPHRMDVGKSLQLDALTQSSMPWSDRRRSAVSTGQPSSADPGDFAEIMSSRLVAALQGRLRLEHRTFDADLAHNAG